MSMVIAGIDPSLTGTAVVISDLANGPEAFKIKRFSSKPQGDDVKNRMARFEELIHRIDAYLEEHGATHLFVENYSFASKFNVTLLGEFGGLLRWHLVTREFVAEVAPSTLKKFVTGAGNTKGKDIMASHMTKRWGVVFNNSDEADSYCLWRLGRCCMSIDVPENDFQRECVGKVMNIEVPKAKKVKPIPPPNPESYF